MVHKLYMIFQSPGNHTTPSTEILKAEGRLQSWIMPAQEAPMNQLILTLYVRFMPRQSAVW